MNTTTTYQTLSPLEVALGAFYNLSKKARTEFLKAISERGNGGESADARMMVEIERGREQIRNGECVTLATDEDFDAYFMTV